MSPKKENVPQRFREGETGNRTLASDVFDWGEALARETIEIPLHEPALYLAVLAYPDRNDASKRREFVEAAHAYHAKFAVQYAKEHLPGSRLIIPADLRRYKNEKVEGVLNKGLRRIRERRDGAFWMAVKVWSGESRNIEEASSRWETLLVERKLRKEPSGLFTDATSPNVKHRVWAQSKPVLHLVFALPLEWHRRITLRLFHHLAGLPTPPDTILGVAGKDGSLQELRLDHLLLSQAWLPESLVQAEIYRERILPHRFPSIDLSETIRLVPKSSKN